MVRIVSVSTLGYDEFGGYFSDREVDGVDYTDVKEKEEDRAADRKPDPSEKVVKPSKLTGGRRSQ